MGEWYFRSEDERFGLHINEQQRGKLYAICSTSGDKETGGILIGRYSQSHDCALVSEITPPPKDSLQQKFRFIRGIIGLQERLKSSWKQNHDYYLGEWHFHPSSSPLYSPVDETQMVAISADQEYHCPEPILLIIGGSKELGWKASVHVFPLSKVPVALLPRDYHLESSACPGTSEAEVS